MGSVIENLIDRWMSKIRPEEKKKMTEKVMERFFADMTGAEKREIMKKMMATMMEGIDISKMMPLITSKMDGDSEIKGMEMIPQMSESMGEEDSKPWVWCAVMEKTLQEVVKTNNQILEELRRK